MIPTALQSQIILSEDSQHQVKVDVRSTESLSVEMAAFAVFELKLAEKTKS